MPNNGWRTRAVEVRGKLGDRLVARQEKEFAGQQVETGEVELVQLHAYTYADGDMQICRCVQYGAHRSKCKYGNEGKRYAGHPVA